tara:strand:- start:1517 stop:2008 length:492 start_codon:yes stop_codon:yes gene_type:complete
MESVSTHRERPYLAKRKRSLDSVIDESFESGRKNQKRIRVVSPDFSHQSTRGIDPVAAAPRQRAASLDLSRTNQSVEITRSVSASDLEVPRPVEALEALAEVAALATPTPPPPPTPSQQPLKSVFEPKHKMEEDLNSGWGYFCDVEEEELSAIFNNLTSITNE